MIIWLASYPRSGNTLLRMILKYVFGQETYSKYNDLLDIGADQKMTEIVGHRMLPSDWESACQKMKQSDSIYFVKTHDYEEKDSKAIYVVRDGRCAVVSYKHYIRNFADKEVLLSHVILGLVPFGSWGGHLDMWNPLTRPNTLFLRYESLLSNPNEEIKKLAKFTGLRVVGEWINDFRSFHKINPKFFREGAISKGKDEIKGENLELFWAVHRDWMDTLNYTEGEDKKIYSLSSLRKNIQYIYECK